MFRYSNTKSIAILAPWENIYISIRNIGTTGFSRNAHISNAFIDLFLKIYTLRSWPDPPTAPVQPCLLTCIHLGVVNLTGERDDGYLGVKDMYLKKINSLLWKVSFDCGGSLHSEGAGWRPDQVGLTEKWVLLKRKGILFCLLTMPECIVLFFFDLLIDPNSFPCNPEMEGYVLFHA